MCIFLGLDGSQWGKPLTVYREQKNVGEIGQPCRGTHVYRCNAGVGENIAINLFVEQFDHFAKHFSKSKKFESSDLKKDTKKQSDSIESNALKKVNE